MFGALLTITLVLQLVLVINLARLLFRSQRPSAKKWLKLSGAAFVVCLTAAGIIAQRDGDSKAAALGFADSSDRQKAKAEGIEDAAAWRVRKAEFEAAAAKQREDDERKAVATRKAAAAQAKADVEKKAAEEKLAAWKEQNCHKDLDCIGTKKRALANAYSGSSGEPRQIPIRMDRWLGGTEVSLLPLGRPGWRRHLLWRGGQVPERLRRVAKHGR